MMGVMVSPLPGPTATSSSSSTPRRARRRRRRGGRPRRRRRPTCAERGRLHGDRRPRRAPRARPRPPTLARDAAAWLVERGHEVRLPRRRRRAAGPRASSACDPTTLAVGLDLAVSLGGDGTMLRTVDLVAGRRRAGARRQRRPARLPHRGRAGRAARRRSSGSSPATTRIEERMMLDGRRRRAGGAAPGRAPALNEAVLEKTPTGHTVRLAVTIDGESVHDLRGRRPHRGHARPARPPTPCRPRARSCRPDHRGPAAHAGVAAHAVRPRRWCSTPTTSVRLEVARRPPGRRSSVDGRNLGDARARATPSSCTRRRPRRPGS